MQGDHARLCLDPARLSGRNKGHCTGTDSFLSIAGNHETFSLEYNQGEIHARAMHGNELPWFKASQDNFDSFIARKRDRIESFRPELHRVLVPSKESSPEITPFIDVTFIFVFIDKEQPFLAPRHRPRSQLER